MTLDPPRAAPPYFPYPHRTQAEIAQEQVASWVTGYGVNARRKYPPMPDLRERSILPPF